MINIKKQKTNKMKSVKKEKLCNIVFVITAVLLVMSLVFELTVSNFYATKGERFAKLEKEKYNLETKIADLKIEKSKLSSLSTVESRALSLGFVENKDPVAVIDSFQFAVAR